MQTQRDLPLLKIQTPHKFESTDRNDTLGFHIPFKTPLLTCSITLHTFPLTPTSALCLLLLIHTSILDQLQPPLLSLSGLIEKTLAVAARVFFISSGKKPVVDPLEGRGFKHERSVHPTWINEDAGAFILILLWLRNFVDAEVLK
ncbi:unnamed protein product, partial [Vitis vinifera]